MAKVAKPIPKEVNEFLCIDPESPSGLSWINGKSAGYLDSKGRWVVKFKQKMYKAHRIVWTISGLPLEIDQVIDHINGNPQCNLVSNLRLATDAQNSHNRVRDSLKRSVLPKGINFSNSPGTAPGYMCARVVLHGQSFSKSSYSLGELVSWLESKRTELHGGYANNGSDIRR